MTGNGVPHCSLAGKRVLVVGAGGFIGSHLVEALLTEAARVGALDVAQGKLVSIPASCAFDFLPCDLRDGDRTRRLVAAFNPQIIFHLASHPDGRETFEQAEASLDGTLRPTVNLLEAFRQCEAPELFVYGDSCKVYGDSAVPYRQTMPLEPLSSYAIAKAAGWRFCRLYQRVHGLPSVAVRPTMIYGPRQGVNLISYVIECVADGESQVRLDGGDQTRDPLFIDDAVEAYLRVARIGKPLQGEAINISGGDERTVLEIASIILRLMESPLRPVADDRRKRSTEMQRCFGDNEEARRLIDWQPRTDLETGLRRTIAYVRRQRRTAVPPRAAMPQPR